MSCCTWQARQGGQGTPQAAQRQQAGAADSMHAYPRLDGAAGAAADAAIHLLGRRHHRRQSIAGAALGHDASQGKWAGVLKWAAATKGGGGEKKGCGVGRAARSGECNNRAAASRRRLPRRIHAEDGTRSWLGEAAWLHDTTLPCSIFEGPSHAARTAAAPPRTFCVAITFQGRQKRRAKWPQLGMGWRKS